MRPARYRFILLTPLAMVLAVGCDRDDAISLYRAPKDPTPAAVSAPAADPAARTSGPLQWTVPAGWKESPAQQMRFAAFRVNDGNPPVEMTVIPLGPEAGALLPNVNRWENQLGLPPSPEAKLSEIVQHNTVNGLHVDQVDLTGPESKTPRQRTLAAIVEYGGRFWFFKLSGPIEVVAAQKQNFDAFVASLRPGENTAQAGPAPSAPPDGSMGQIAPQQTISKLASFRTPEGWREIPNPTPPRVMALEVGSGDQKAEMIATRFAANNTGSFADNINRWRGQIGLPPVADPRTVPMQDTKVGKDGEGILLDFQNPETSQPEAGKPGKRMLVLIASAHGDLWFFKLTGPSELVAAQRANFDSFIQSLEFAGEGETVEPKP